MTTPTSMLLESFERFGVIAGAAFASMADSAREAGRAMKLIRSPLREATLRMRHHQHSRGLRRHIRRQKQAAR